MSERVSPPLSLDALEKAAKEAQKWGADAGDVLADKLGPDTLLALVAVVRAGLELGEVLEDECEGRGHVPGCDEFCHDAVTTQHGRLAAALAPFKEGARAESTATTKIGQALSYGSSGVSEWAAESRAALTGRGEAPIDE